MLKHRNSQKRIIFEDAVYFVTSKTHNNYPYFRERIFCDLFVGNLKLCKRLKGFLLYGWVLVYSHFHLLIQPNDEFDVSKVMFSVKKQFSHNCNIVMGYNKPYIPPEGGQSIVRLRDGRSVVNRDYVISVCKLHKFDRFVQISKFRFKIKYLNHNPFPKFQWQESFNDHYIRNDSDFDYHMDYIDYNPIKHGLPDNWPYVYTNPDFEELTDEF